MLQMADRQMSKRARAHTHDKTCKTKKHFGEAATRLQNLRPKLTTVPARVSATMLCEPCPSPGSADGSPTTFAHSSKRHQNGCQLLIEPPRARESSSNTTD